MVMLGVAIRYLPVLGALIYCYANWFSEGSDALLTSLLTSLPLLITANVVCFLRTKFALSPRKVGAFIQLNLAFFWVLLLCPLNQASFIVAPLLTLPFVFLRVIPEPGKKHFSPLSLVLLILVGVYRFSEWNLTDSVLLSNMYAIILFHAFHVILSAGIGDFLIALISFFIPVVGGFSTFAVSSHSFLIPGRSIPRWPQRILFILILFCANFILNHFFPLIGFGAGLESYILSFALAEAVWNFTN